VALVLDNVAISVEAVGKGAVCSPYDVVVTVEVEGG